MEVSFYWNFYLFKALSFCSFSIHVLWEVQFLEPFFIMCSAPHPPPSPPQPHITKLITVNIHVRNGWGWVGITGGMLELEASTWRCRGGRYVRLLSVAFMLERFSYRTVGSLSITYPECVSVALGIQHAMRMHHLFICGLSGYSIFSHIMSYAARFLKKKVNNHKMFFFLYSIYQKHFSF
jgi:hypothetical protein